MNIVPRPWREPTVARESGSPAEVTVPTAKMPVDVDLAALLANDDTLLSTLLEQCRIRNLYLVHDGREIKVSPVIEPGWRVIHEVDKSAGREAA